MNERLSPIVTKRGAAGRRCFLVLMAFPVWASNLAFQNMVAAPTPDSVIHKQDLLVAFDAIRRVALGMTRDQVVMSMLGEPDDKLGSNLWIYWGFKARGRPSSENYTALIVVFVRERVTLIRLAEASATKRLLPSASR